MKGSVYESPKSLCLDMKLTWAKVRDMPHYHSDQWEGLHLSWSDVTIVHINRTNAPMISFWGKLVVEALLLMKELWVCRALDIALEWKNMKVISEQTKAHDGQSIWKTEKNKLVLIHVSLL